MPISEAHNIDCMEYMKGLPDCSVDIIFTDPPYALGSEIIIRQDGKPDYKKAVDFMNKWQMPGGYWWEQWFAEAFRILKYGGRCLMFSIDRQAFLFKYYASLAQFTESQSIYWFFISSFPKSTDLSKAIDKHFGEDVKEFGCINIAGKDGRKAHMAQSNEKVNRYEKQSSISDLAKKYDGFKYSCAPLKQTVETIMVFQKPYKTGSCLHDTLAMEEGDNEITCGAMDIDGNKVPTGEKLNYGDSDRKNIGFKLSSENKKRPVYDREGRYPSQSFVDSGAAEILDKQSGILTSGKAKIGTGNIENQKDTGIYGRGLGHNITTCYSNDIAGCSKILHKCDYEEDEIDLYMYCPKVSPSERNEGCEKLPEKNSANLPMRSSEIDSDNEANDGTKTHRQTKSTNNHPTVKPISLAEKIIGLFKMPNKQFMLDPFMGSGSLIIGGNNKGFETIGIELNPEYFEIANARIEHWANKKKNNESQQTIKFE